MQRQRRPGAALQQPRNSNPAVENGDDNMHAGGQLCPGGSSACVSVGSSGYGCGCGWCSTRKSSPLRRAVTSLRVHLSSGCRKKAAGAYLVACVLLVWFGLQVSAVLRGGTNGSGVVEAGGGQRQQQHQRQQPARQEERRELASARGGREGGDSSTIKGYGEDDIGPTIAYGIMVYQRKEYSPQSTLDQFARMFNALYDEENT